MFAGILSRIWSIPTFSGPTRSAIPFVATQAGNQYCRCEEYYALQHVSFFRLVPVQRLSSAHLALLTAHYLHCRLSEALTAFVIAISVCLSLSIRTLTTLNCELRSFHYFISHRVHNIFPADERVLLISLSVRMIAVVRNPW
jgi:hypothetical protein